MNGNFSSDGSTPWVKINGSGGFVISAHGTFGDGTISAEHKVNGNTYPMCDNIGVAFKWNYPFDFTSFAGQGLEVRLTLSGSTSPNIDWQISGPGIPS